MTSVVTVAPKRTRKVKSILVSQPAPESRKSPYYQLAEQYNIKIDFRPFIQVDGVTAREFRKARVTINDYSAVIFTSRNTIDHFFRICEALRIKMSQETKYFCISEAIALYLQKYIQYRKRKVFYGNGTQQELKNLLNKYKNTERILYPCSDARKATIPDFLESGNFNFSEAVICKTVVSDLSDLEKITYDMIVFFSPSGLKSLFENFPNFEQKNTRIAAFGTETAKSVEEHGLTLDVRAPVPEARSMTMAIENYLKVVNK